MKVETVVEIEASVINDLIVTAVEGGSNYWALITKKSANYLTSVGDEAIWVELMTDEGEYPCRVGVAQIEEGIRRLVGLTKGHEWARRQMDNLLNENWDAETADVILQLAVLGDVVYG